MKIFTGLTLIGILFLGFYAENVNGVSPNEIIHYGAPDEFKNQLGTPVFIHVKDKNGAKKPALLSSSSKADSVLKKDQKKKINSTLFRRGNGEKIELIVTVPGVQSGQGQNWDYKDVKWVLGEGHEPSFTRTKFHKNPKRGYEIIFVYEEGLIHADTLKNKLEKLEKGMLDDAEAEELRKHLITHVQGHICDPLDPNCGGSG